MGRQARRQQARAERRSKRQQRGGRQRGGGSNPAMQVATRPDEPARGGGSIFRPRWATDIISELRKVTWPSRQETAHLTLVVVVVSIIFGAILGGADVGFGWIIERTILR